jgi:serine/threonine protein kinase
MMAILQAKQHELTPVQSSKRKTQLASILNKEVGSILLGQEIGRGSFGVIYRGQWCGSTVAIKVIKLPNRALSEYEKELCENEVILMRHSQHMNVLLCLGIVHNPLESLIIMELALSSVANAISSRDVVPVIPDVLLLSWLLDAATGLQHLHLMHIIHNDVKSANIC